MYVYNFGSSLSNFSGTQWTAIYLTDVGADKSLAFHHGVNMFFRKTCWSLSPVMPQFSALYNLKYFFHTVWCLLSPATIKSQVKNTEDAVVAKSYDRPCITAIAINGRIMIKYYADFVGSFFDVCFTEHSKNGQFFYPLRHTISTACILCTETVNKVKKITIISFSSKFLSGSAFASNRYWNHYIQFSHIFFLMIKFFALFSIFGGV